MKRKLLPLLIFIMSAIYCCKQDKEGNDNFKPFVPPVSFENAGARADSIIKLMSVDEKIEMIGGHNMFYVKGFEKYGIPELFFSDATQGVHLRKELSKHLEKSTAFPCPLALTATWNPELAHEYAKSIGEECRAGNIAVLLGPGMNIYRMSENGRNFEYFGEDPYLAARMVENYVTGMQSTGTMATLKHFLANNSDHRRRFTNSIVDDRTLNEIYLPAFKAGIDAGAMAVMTSYNMVNGEYTGQSDKIINGLLRNRLGFRWLVMTDWWSVYDPAKVIKSGMDLEMPGHALESIDALKEIGDVYLRSNAKRLLEEGKITEAEIDRMVKNIMTTFIAMGVYDRPVLDTLYKKNFAQHEETALKTAREAIVLLRNEDKILPVKKEHGKNVLLAGDFIEKIAAGGGSAFVEGYNHISMARAFSNEFGDALVIAANPSEDQVKSASVVFYSIGTLDSEGWNRPFNLPDSVEAAIQKVCSLNSNVVVIVNSGSGINMSGWNTKVKGIIYAWYTGQNGHKALAEIITGKVNPSGKLPVTIEKKFEDSPAYPYLREGEQPDTNWNGDMAWKTPKIDIEYKEGIFVGYRWYESKKIEPLYPFGFGLSYSKFEISDAKIVKNQLSENGKLSISCSVKNTGSADGAEVVQVYVRDVEASVPRPVKELKSFRKVYLKAGESETLTFGLDKNSFSFYDINTSSWKMESGKFEIMIGNSSASLSQVLDINF